MVDYDYDTSPFFKYLPSAWQDMGAAQQPINSVYEGWMRAMDTEYAVIEQTDNAKDLATLPSFTRYPAVYSELNDWTSLGGKHAHKTINFDWPSSTENGEYVIRIENQLISEDAIVYI